MNWDDAYSALMVLAAAAAFAALAYDSVPVIAGLLLISTSAAAARKMMRKKTENPGGIAERISLARRFLGAYYTRRCSVAAAISSSEGTHSDAGKEISHMMKRYMLGDVQNAPDLRMGREPSGLAAVIWNSAVEGGTPARGVELFIRGAEIEERQRIAVREKAGGMEAISMAGLVFFFPLFGGITLGIIRNYFGTGASGNMIPALSLLLASYALVMLVLTQGFWDIGRDAKALARKVAPAFIFGVAVLLFSSTYISKIL